VLVLDALKIMDVLKENKNVKKKMSQTTECWYCYSVTEGIKMREHYFIEEDKISIDAATKFVSISPQMGYIIDSDVKGYKK